MARKQASHELVIGSQRSMISQILHQVGIGGYLTEENAEDLAKLGEKHTLSPDDVIALAELRRTGNYQIKRFKELLEEGASVVRIEVLYIARRVVFDELSGDRKLSSLSLEDLHQFWDSFPGDDIGDPDNIEDCVEGIRRIIAKGKKHFRTNYASDVLKQLVCINQELAKRDLNRIDAEALLDTGLTFETAPPYL